MKKQYYNYNDGETTDESLWEIIQYMVDNDIEKEDIIGTVLEVCEETSVYSNVDYIKIQDILYAEIDIYEGEYFEREIAEILKKVENVKYLNPVSKYTIDETDWEDYLR
jgi:hypothetical protein